MENVIYAKPVGYKLVEFLGEGLNSCVYRAFKETKEHNLKFEVALKILKSEKPVEIWRSEFERLSQLKSQHCVRLYGWEFINNRPTLILEYVHGVTLEELMCNSNNLTAADYNEVLYQVYMGLQDLNLNKLFHGDLNFHNIMIDIYGRVKLVDFGVFDAEKTVMTTLCFAAPELLLGESPTFQTDLYSLYAIRAEIVRLKNIILAENFSRVATEHFEQRSLGSKVAKVLEQKKLKKGKTARLHIKRRKQNIFRPLMRMAIMLCLVTASLLSRGDQLSSVSIKPAIITVRSTNWVNIIVNNKNLGFGPLDTYVSPNTKILLRWVNAEGEHQTSLTLSGGQHIILDDEYFRFHNIRNDSRSN